MGAQSQVQYKAVPFFTSSRGFGNEPLAAPLDFDQLQRRLHAPGNGLRDIYVVDARVLGS